MTLRNQFINPDDQGTEITRHQLEELIELQSKILGELVVSDNCDALLDKICLFAEKLTPNAVASIMLIDKEKQQMFVRSAPSIPAKALDDLNGLKVGDGSCGNAVYHNEDMYVCNTLTDARWGNIKEFARDYKIHACWSSPVHNTNNEPIASFALSSFATRTPDNFQRRLLNICASITGIVLQREKSITEQHEWQEQLRVSKENLAVTVDSIADGVISTDTEGNILIFNKIAEQLTGWSSEKATGKKLDTVFNIINAKNVEILCNPFNCLDEKKKCYRNNDDLRLVAADGTKRFVSISEAPIKNDKGKVSGTVIAFRDITQHRADQDALIESRQQYRSFVDNSADAMFLHNDEGQYLDVNQAACDNLGYSREELLSMSVPDIEKGETSFEKFKEFANSLEIDKTYTLESIQQRKDKTRFPAEIRLRKFITNNQSILVALSRDVTDRTKAEEELLKARKLDSIGLLAGGIAHDFNNMLGIIQGYIDLAGRSANTPEKLGKFLKKAYKASTQAADLTQQLLTFSKGGEPIKKAANILDIIHQTTDFNLHGSNVRVNYHRPNDLWTANIDSGQISQVIQNLTINARQAMPDGGILDIYCENTVVSESDNAMNLACKKYIKVIIKDNGPGIPQDLIDSVFDPYFTTKQEGSGLGLALSYSIIKKHLGYIAVDSIQGEGTKFTIYLPATEEQTKSAAGSNALAANKKESVRIMIMDDDPLLREVSEEMLENLGYEVIQAADGETAKNLYENAIETRNNIDLIIMDLTIPSGIGGKEAIKLIQKIDPEVKALVSSGYCNDPVMANYDDYGFKGAVSKPYSQDELATAVSAILNRN